MRIAAVTPLEVNCELIGARRAAVTTGPFTAHHRTDRESERESNVEQRKDSYKRVSDDYGQT
jgi:hypothetical protein